MSQSHTGALLLSVLRISHGCTGGSIETRSLPSRVTVYRPPLVSVYQMKAARDPSGARSGNHSRSPMSMSGVSVVIGPPSMGIAYNFRS